MTDSAIKGMVFDVQRYSLHDGPGVRTVVFFKGCPLRCKWCCNPESWKIHTQLSYMPARCIGCGACISACPQGCIQASGSAILYDPKQCVDCGSCVQVCYPQARFLSGREMSVQEVLSQVLKDRKYYEHSGGGITLSGGEVSLQWEFAAALLREAKRCYLHTAVETTGYAAWEHLWPILENTDVVLYDLKHMDAAKHREYTGVDNALILENLKRLVARGRHTIIRLPLIPEHNDDAENLEATARFAQSLNGVREVHILPYHQLGVSKYPLLDYTYPLRELKPPTQERIKFAENIFKRYGFQTQING